MLTTGIPADHPALAECCEFLNISLDSERMPPGWLPGWVTPLSIANCAPATMARRPSENDSSW
jgi:hypothetical protein